jgi:hypothetical protein
MIPVIKPIMATVAIFAAVNQWNAFQDTLLLVTDTKLYPLQFVLYQYLNQASSLSALANTSSSSSLAAAWVIPLLLSVTIATLGIRFPHFRMYASPPCPVSQAYLRLHAALYVFCLFGFIFPYIEDVLCSSHLAEPGLY